MCLHARVVLDTPGMYGIGRGHMEFQEHWLWTQAVSVKTRVDTGERVDIGEQKLCFQRWTHGNMSSCRVSVTYSS